MQSLEQSRKNMKTHVIIVYQCIPHIIKTVSAQHASLVHFLLHSFDQMRHGRWEPASRSRASSRSRFLFPPVSSCFLLFPPVISCHFVYFQDLSSWSHCPAGARAEACRVTRAEGNRFLLEIPRRTLVSLGSLGGWRLVQFCLTIFVEDACAAKELAENLHVFPKVSTSADLLAFVFQPAAALHQN